MYRGWVDGKERFWRHDPTQEAYSYIRQELKKGRKLSEIEFCFHKVI